MHLSSLRALIMLRLVLFRLVLGLLLRRVAIGAWTSVLSMLLRSTTRPFLSLLLVCSSISVFVAVLVSLTLVLLIAASCVGLLAARVGRIVVVALVVHLDFRLLLTSVHFQ